MLWLLRPFTSGLEVWLSVLFYVNSKFRLLLPFNNNNLDFEALGIWPFHNLSVCVTVVYWLLDCSSSFTEDFQTHFICLFSAPKSLWTLGASINRPRSQLLNTLVSEAPDFLISSLSIITSVPFYPLIHTIKLWACLSPGNTTHLKSECKQPTLGLNFLTFKESKSVTADLLPHLFNPLVHLLFVYQPPYLTPFLFRFLFILNYKLPLSSRLFLEIFPTLLLVVLLNVHRKNILINLIILPLHLGCFAQLKNSQNCAI